MTRSGLTLAAAVAILAAGVVIVIGGESEESAPSTSQARPTSEVLRVGEEGSAFTFGRGATDPAAAAASAATKADAQSALHNVGLPDVDPCSLLSETSVDAAIGSDWHALPSRTAGTLQCRWQVDSDSPLGGDEVHVTVAQSELYRNLDAPRAETLSGLGDEATIVSSGPSGRLVAVLENNSAVFVALTSRARPSESDVIALTQEAIRRVAIESRPSG